MFALSVATDATVLADATQSGTVALGRERGHAAGARDRCAHRHGGRGAVQRRTVRGFNPDVSLRCAVCHAVQPVNVADEADEDLRTQGIRRTFRADHVASCGDGAVTFVLHAETAAVDLPTPAWMSTAPDGVTLGADGFFSRMIVRDGVSMPVRVCEDCWETIPRYIDFPLGLTSPESDLGAGKFRQAVVDGKIAAEHLPKAVCLPCYLDAFARMYPGATLPDLRRDVLRDGQQERAVREHLTSVDAGFIEQPRASA
jgi:hypothetical protein